MGTAVILQGFIFLVSLYL